MWFIALWTYALRKLCKYNYSCYQTYHKDKIYSWGQQLYIYTLQQTYEEIEWGEEGKSYETKEEYQIFKRKS